MGFYVKLAVTFTCSQNEPVAAIAQRHLDLLPTDEPPGGDETPEVRWFLTALSHRRGENPGPKGGMSLWGIVGNYSSADAFTEKLRPFWRDLLAEPRSTVHGHVLVFEQGEASDTALAYQISRNYQTGEVDIAYSTLPVGW